MAGWKARRTVTFPPRDPKQPEMRGLDCCYVVFPTGEFLQPDGRDLRVFISGKAAPFKVVDIGFGGVVRLVAGIPSTSLGAGPAGADRMTIYYGNPAAPKLDSDWEPQRGLWLETRRYKGGECNTLRGIQAAWAKSTERLGAGLAEKIFQGFNPYGPSDSFLSFYAGWLYVPKDVRITFAVLADDMGYLLVEDKLVAAKSEGGPMPGHRQFHGDPMLLQAGIHPIKMYHAQFGGQTAAGAAWWMPGMPKGEKYLHFQIIPETAYAPVRYGRLFDYEVRGQPIAPDFQANNEGNEVLDDSRLLVRFTFREMSRPADQALKCQPFWEFGDGTSTEARDPSHVYLTPGDYTVSLTLRRGDKAYVERQKIRAGPSYERGVTGEAGGLAVYYPILKDYQFDKMSTPDLVTAARIVEVLEKPDEIVAVCTALYSRADTLDDATLVRHCLLLGRPLRDREGKAEEAIRVFQRAEERTKDIHAKARLANEIGDVYFYFLNDLPKADKEYTKTLTAYVRAADDQVRLAQIRLGDVYRAKGDAEAARKAYERAADMPIAGRSEMTAAARRGSFAHDAEDYTRRKLFKEAHAELDEWDWEFPTDKLDGYSSLLRARLALAEARKAEADEAIPDKKEEAARLAKSKTDEAIKQAKELIRVNKNSEYADDLLLFLTDLCLAKGRPDDALESASTLLKDYPASELQEAAHLRRAAIHLQQGKNDEAAKEALELAKSTEFSDNAPKALLLAATAQTRQQKKDEAIQTLERLTQKYPTSKEATEGLKMLKELRGK